MNRPQKNKASNPTLPEDQQVDERNIIDLDESAELSFEDRLHLYWVENKGVITGTITVLALFIIGFNGLRIYKEAAESKIQSAYAEAKANGALESFALEYSNKDLGGFAALLVADEFYTLGNYESAADFYGKASSALESDLLVARAQLGLSFAKYYGASKEEGRTMLEGIAADPALADAVRLEAAYHLAIDADVNGDTAAFENYSTQLSSSAVSSQWQQRMDLYRQQR